MAIKINGKTVKAKAKTSRNPLLVDEKYTGPEPVWDTDRAMQMSQDEFDHHLRRSLFYYNYFYTQKDTKKHVVEWLKSNKEFTKDEVRAFERSPDRAVSMTVHGLVMSNRQGMPLKDRHLEFVHEQIGTAIRSMAGIAEVEVTEEKPKIHVVTIQDRLNEKTSEHIGEFEGAYDDIILNRKCEFKPYEYLTGNNIPQSQLGKYEQVFRDRKAELELAVAKADPQLVEGYKHYKAADFKRLIGWLDQVLTSIEQYRGVKKATKKARVKKAPSKEKLVSKLKYAKEDKELKLVSINPAEIIGSQELWVYNFKTRKLGKYLAAQYGALGVKGTSVTGYDENKSVSKTLRKPEEKLKEFIKAGKVQLRKFLEDIRATETKLNGRINSDMILLKVQ
jgi:hypothetical protein